MSRTAGRMQGDAAWARSERQAEALGHRPHHVAQGQPVGSDDVVGAAADCGPLEGRRDGLRDVAHVHGLQEGVAAADDGEDRARTDHAHEVRDHVVARGRR